MFQNGTKGKGKPLTFFTDTMIQKIAKYAKSILFYMLVFARMWRV